MNDDLEIMKLLEVERNPKYIVQLLLNLKEDKNKAKYLHLLPEGKDYLSVIMSMNLTDKLRLKFIKKLDYLNAKVELAISMEDVNNKIGALDYIPNNKMKAAVIKSMADEDKLKAITKIKSSDEICDIFKSFQDKNKIKEHIHDIEDEELKSIGISFLENDEDKVSLLKEIKEEDNKAEIIASLDNDNHKLRLINSLNNQDAKAFVLLSIEDSRLIKNAFHNMTYDKIGLPQNMSIGIEIEVEGPYSKRIKRLNNILQRWEVTWERSVEDGIEIKSPILYDNETDITEIYFICNLLKKMEQYTSEHCGGHIHIGADYLKTKESYVNLLELWGNTEEIVMKICNEEGDIPRAFLGLFSAPISYKLLKALNKKGIDIEGENDLNNFITNIQNIQSTGSLNNSGTRTVGRCSSINFLNVNSKKNTIECRASNGTINPDTWIENIRLFGRFIQKSQEIADCEKSEDRTPSQERKINLREWLKDDLPEEDKLAILLNLLCDEKERIVYEERFDENSKLLKIIPQDMNALKDLKFASKVDFKKYDNDEREER